MSQGNPQPLTHAAEEREVVFGLTSLAPDKATPAKPLTLNRNHWGTDSNLRSMREVTFEENHSRVGKNAGPGVMASVRNLAIGLLRMAGADGERSFREGFKNYS